LGLWGYGGNKRGEKSLQIGGDLEERKHREQEIK